VQEKCLSVVHIRNAVLTWVDPQANQYHGNIVGTFSKHVLQTG